MSLAPSCTLLPSHIEGVTVESVLRSRGSENIQGPGTTHGPQGLQKLRLGECKICRGGSTSSAMETTATIKNRSSILLGVLGCCTAELLREIEAMSHGRCRQLESRLNI